MPIAGTRLLEFPVPGKKKTFKNNDFRLTLWGVTGRGSMLIFFGIVPGRIKDPEFDSCKAEKTR